jgi:hypothetical protein
LFEEFAQPNPKDRPNPRPRNRATVKDYKAERHDMELRAALDNFRRQETIRKFGLSRLKNSGPGLIMPNAILKRIVDCAHAMKINSKEDLQLETQWSRANIYSEEILTLIKIHHAPPEPVPASTSCTEPAGRTKCSRCGQKGHNSV